MAYLFYSSILSLAYLLEVMTRKHSAIILVGLALSCSLSATDLTIHLPESPSISRQSVAFQCDANGSRIGVPSGPFLVEYINGGGNSLVVVPISGNALIFSGVRARSYLIIAEGV